MMKKVILLAGSLMAFTAGVFAATTQPIKVYLKNKAPDRIVMVTAVGEKRWNLIPPLKCAPTRIIGNTFIVGEIKQQLLPSMLTNDKRLASIGLINANDKSPNLINTDCFSQERYKIYTFTSDNSGNIVGNPDDLRYFSLFIGVSKVPFKIKIRDLSNVQFVKAPDPSASINLVQPTSPDQLTWYEKKLKPEDNGTTIHFYHPEKQKEQFDRQGQFKPVKIK